MLVPAVLATLSLSCRHEATPGIGHLARCESLYNMMLLINDADSLGTMARDYHRQGDADGEMIALFFQGRNLSREGRYTEAKAALGQGMEVATRLNDTLGLAMGLSYQSQINYCQGDLSNANGCCYQALKLCEQYHNQQWIGTVRTKAEVLCGMGNVERVMYNLPTADSVLHQSLAIMRSLDDIRGIAANYLYIGRVKKCMSDLDSAWYYFRQSMDLHRQMGSRGGMAACHLYYGELYEAENKFTHAVKENTIALDEFEAIGDTWLWLKACIALARIHVLMGDEAKVHHYILEADTVADRIGSRAFQCEISMIHYQLSLLQGDHKEALQHYLRGAALQDSIFGLVKNDEMRAQRKDYYDGHESGEVNSLTQDIDRLKRSRKMQFLFMIVMTLMAGAIIAALVYAVRVRTRTQRLMRQVEETRSLFFTNVVHQLRTPLSAIMGAADSIMDKVKAAGNDDVYTERMKDSGEIIERQGNNLLTLVDRILEVGSVRSAITELDWQTMDAVTFIQMIVESYRERCMERNIELTYASRETEADVDAVPRYLAVIMASLIENAINYSRDFSKITVTSRVENNRLVICVADNGMGIDSKDLPHVFEPFYRSADAEALIEGVGIGLTVVRDMTMAMHGMVAADSMKEHGSVFTVKLPCKRGKGLLQRFDDAIEPLLGNKVRRQQQFKHGDRQPVPLDEERPVALVVEDHIDVARLVGNVLGDRYNVRYALDGMQGLAMAGDCVPDIIITDVKMPLMDGIEMCRRLRLSRQLCHIPVIMLSARNADADRVSGIEAGADAYLVKPFVSEELRAWVDRLIKTRQMLKKAYTRQPIDLVDIPVDGIEDTSEEDAAFLEAFAREVDKQFVSGGKVNLDEVARSFKMGESQLRRKVQSLTKKKVPAYIIQLRMEKAIRLLQESSPDTLISTIAEQCGILDVSYFSRVFREYYGKTPSQVRKK